LAVFCDSGKEHFCSIKCREFLDHLSNC
jgi:hypothetical protein